jgi:hypothetical protein
MATRECNFAGLIFGPQFPPGVSLIFPPFPTKRREASVRSLGKQLFEDDLTLEGDFDTPGYPSTTVIIERPEMTAAVVRMLRVTDRVQGELVSGRLCALAIFITGIDKLPDENAIARVRLLVAEHALPVAERWFDQIRSDQRPLAALLCRNAATRADPSIHFAFEVAAQAFFQQFGADGNPWDMKDRQIHDLPP